MIELVEHLRFVERQITSVVADVDVALAAVTFLLQALRLSGSGGSRWPCGRASLNESRHGLASGLVPVRLTPEHGDTAVDGLGQLSVGVRSKDRAVARVGIEKIDVFGRKRETASPAYEISSTLNALKTKTAASAAGCFEPPNVKRQNVIATVGCREDDSSNSRRS